MKYIDAGDFFLIAAAVLEQSIDAIVDETNVALLFSALDPPRATIGGVDVFASLAQKAAILCIRIARNAPLRRGNTAVAYAAMRELFARNDVEWHPQGGPENAYAVMDAMASEQMTEAEFMLWVDHRR
jgi:prophage maintenance system killer protein